MVNSRCASTSYGNTLQTVLQKNFKWKKNYNLENTWKIYPWNSIKIWESSRCLSNLVGIIWHLSPQNSNSISSFLKWIEYTFVWFLYNTVDSSFGHQAVNFLFYCWIGAVDWKSPDQMVGTIIFNRSEIKIFFK